MIAIALIRINYYYGKHTTFLLLSNLTLKINQAEFFHQETFPNFEIFYEFPANKTIFE